MNKMFRSLALSIGFILLLVPFTWAFDHSYQTFTAILQESVVVKGAESAVRYGVIQAHPDALNQYITEIEAVSKNEFMSWTENQQMAFLINAYNALTIKLILSRYPDLASIKDLGGFFSSPWKIKFFTLFGEPSTLDYIEHEVLRKNYSEPRIHFALVCASISCPPLEPEAYLPETLNEQLNDAMRTFLQNPERNRFDRTKNRLYLSSIFKWYKEDFIAAKGSVEAFVAPWITDDIQDQQLIANQQVDISYLDYDWSLNRAN